MHVWWLPIIHALAHMSYYREPGKPKGHGSSINNLRGGQCSCGKEPYVHPRSGPTILDIGGSPSGTREFLHKLILQWVSASTAPSSSFPHFGGCPMLVPSMERRLRPLPQPLGVGKEGVGKPRGL